MTLEKILKLFDKWLTLEDKDFCPFITKKDFCSVGKYKGRCLYGTYYEGCDIYQINKEGTK